MPSKRKSEAVTTPKPTKRVKTGGASTHTSPRNKSGGNETPANSNIKKKKPEQPLYQSPRPSTATVDDAEYSPFMALPTELRCHIYGDLADIIYDPVFPEPCICSWEVYQMSTPLLLLNKTIYEEVKHPTVQKPLQKVNDHLVPKLVLGPTRTELDLVYTALSDTFHRAGKQLRTFLNGPQKHSGAVKYVSLKISSWYNDTYLSQHMHSGRGKVSNTQIKCQTKRLHRFLNQTMKRVAVRKTCEISIRLLIHPLGLLHKRDYRSRVQFSSYMYYERKVAEDSRRALSVGMERELKKVYSLCKHTHLDDDIVATMVNYYKGQGMNIKLAETRERDWDLFDMAKSLY